MFLFFCQLWELVSIIANDEKKEGVGLVIDSYGTFDLVELFCLDYYYSIISLHVKDYFSVEHKVL